MSGYEWLQVCNIAKNPTLNGPYHSKADKNTRVSIKIG